MFILLLAKSIKTIQTQLGIFSSVRQALKMKKALWDLFLILNSIKVILLNFSLFWQRRALIFKMAMVIDF